MVSEWDVVWRLALTFGLTAAIGLERELRQKSAGLRTHTLVGLGCGAVHDGRRATASPT